MITCCTSAEISVLVYSGQTTQLSTTIHKMVCTTITGCSRHNHNACHVLEGSCNDDLLPFVSNEGSCRPITIAP